jgi:putative nucleotidyltransferase with HDIG domain
MPQLQILGRSVEAGEIAAREYIAPRDVLVADDETTNERRRRAREAVLPVYDYDAAYAREVDESLARLFATARLWLSQGVPLGEGQAGAGDAADTVTSLVDQLQETSGVRLDVEAYVQLIELGFSTELEEALRAMTAEAFRRGIVANKDLLLEHRARGVVLRNLESGSEQVRFNLFDYLGYPGEVEIFLGTQLRREAELSANQRNELRDFLITNTTPNVYPNRTETLARQEEAAAATAPVFHQVQSGQVIVRKGDQIGPAAARAIAELRGDRSLGAQLPPFLGNVLLLGFAALVLWAGLKDEHYPHKTHAHLFSESLILLAIMLSLARLGYWISEGLGNHAFGFPGAGTSTYVYAIPVASLALVTVMLYGRGMALLLALVYSVLTARIGGAQSLAPVIYTLAGSLAAIFTFERFQIKHRFALARIGMVLSVVNVVAILMLRALFQEGRTTALDQIGLDAFCGVIGGLLVAATASFLTPILEGLFSITTDLRLVELSNTNLPVLRRLAFEAPGSFQHSLMVANLAKAGSSAIGADATLAYTAGLYHDIGKIYRPEYFIENQHPGQNPHDKLSPSMSTLVLVSHIKDGLDLARQHRLPRPIHDAIEQHHGTALIKFFYQRAVEQSGDADRELEESDYRYPGPRPQTRVMGVLMLADGVEAASRTLRDPTHVTIRSLIRKICDVNIQDGQLDETDLTLSDLSKIADAFFQVLSNIFHRRVDYPGFDFEERRRTPRPERGLPSVEPSQGKP